MVKSFSERIHRQATNFAAQQAFQMGPPMHAAVLQGHTEASGSWHVQLAGAGSLPDVVGGLKPAECFVGFVFEALKFHSRLSTCPLTCCAGPEAVCGGPCAAGHLDRRQPADAGAAARHRRPCRRCGAGGLLKLFNTSWRPFPTRCYNLLLKADRRRRSSAQAC